MSSFATRPARRRLCAALVAALPVFAACTTGSSSAETAADDGVRVNEVVTTGDVGDSVELYNTGTRRVDVSGWVLKDGGGSSFTIPSGAELAPGGFASFDVHDSFGLGSRDEVRLYHDEALADSFDWDEHSDRSWSRCQDGSGSFVQSDTITLGVANACGDDDPAAWPGGASVSTADAEDVFGTDLSGLYQEGDVMWAAQNHGRLWRLVPDGSGGWRPDTADGWDSGRKLRFPDGSGTPDDEGVTVTGSGSDAGVFVASERDEDAGDTSRLFVLRYDTASGADGASTALTAAQEWDLTPDLPATEANAGLESIAWVPDTALTSAGFQDAATGGPYDPDHYGAHGAGVFFVAVESTGTVYGYVLADDGTATRVAAFASGLSGVMELQWEPQASRLWAVCDDTCDGEHRTLRIGASGTFTGSDVYERPGGMPNLNNEGFTVSPQARCSGGSKPVYWSDDGDTDGHALRRGTITC